MWHIYPFRCIHRDKLQNKLKEVGIQSLIHYPIPPHLSQAYQELGYKKGDFPETESLAEQELSLPIGPHLTQSQVEYVAEQVKYICSRL